MHVNVFDKGFVILKVDGIEENDKIFDPIRKEWVSMGEVASDGTLDRLIALYDLDFDIEEQKQ